MNAINEVSATKAAGIGALYVLASPKQWIFTQSAIATIVEAEPALWLGVALYLFFVVGTQITLLVPLALLAIAPQQVGQPLKTTYSWLERNNQTILLVASIIFGVWFTYKGISGLLA
jgi:threonine/homoserine/homoserine lactone efflux protein